MRELVLDAAPTFSALREQFRGCPKTERVLLLVPPGHLLPRGGLILVLLRRLADTEGMELGLVSDNPALRRQALALGLPAFRTVQMAEKNSHIWSYSERREQVGFARGDVPRPPDTGYRQSVGKPSGPIP